MIARIERLFHEHFGLRTDLLFVRSPGRVNLIGEHTDYNEGFVLPAAIDRALVFAVAPRSDLKCRIVAGDLHELYECDLVSFQPTDRGWPNYVMGIFDQFQKAGARVKGCDIVFGGNLPVGAGLSSSAAVEGGVAYALNELFELRYDRRSLAQLAQRAENDFVGVKCGIMDQFVNMLGKAGHALRIDCRSLASENVPFTDPAVRIVLCETPARRELATSEYNVRRRQCEDGVNVLQRTVPEIRSLRDVTPAMLELHGHVLDPVVCRRCRHVVLENARVLSGCEDLRRGDLTAFGHRMFASHASLQNDYEVSSPDLDRLVELAKDEEGVYGARMMGAGFGGCTINLVRADAVARFGRSVAERFRRATGKEIRVFEAAISEGTARCSSPQTQFKELTSERR